MHIYIYTQTIVVQYQYPRDVNGLAAETKQILSGSIVKCEIFLQNVQKAGPGSFLEEQEMWRREAVRCFSMEDEEQVSDTYR